jgi:hypothetical protein
MNAIALTAPATTRRRWTDAIRVGLIALGIVVLVALSFVAGRATATATTIHRVPTIAPAATVPTNTGPTDTVLCHFGRPC